jgi:hypothetical protein
MPTPENVRFFMEAIPMFQRETPWLIDGPRPANEVDRFKYPAQWRQFEESLEHGD